MNPVDGGNRWEAPNPPLAETVAALGKEVRDLRASARMRFTATWRPSDSWRASQTSPMPPRPIRRRSA